mgnify:CR=1 FL=1
MTFKIGLSEPGLVLLKLVSADGGARCLDRQMRGSSMYRFLLGAAIAASATSAFAADAPVGLDEELSQPHVSG